ncbi:MAG: hypothetical protein AAGG55_17070 [Pseudomonadota bacterium]
MAGSSQLLVAAILSFGAALLHVGVIFGGPDWYRFFGAGEGMARLAESGSRYPTLVTTGITLVLMLWGLYALSGAGVILRLPLLKLGLSLITAVYLLRGLAGLVLPFVSTHPAIQQNSVTFWIVSSLICTAFGAVHLLGLMNSWSRL